MQSSLDRRSVLIVTVDSWA